MGDNGNIFAVIVLAVVVAIIIGGWLAFPAITHFMQNQNCIATGHTNC
jgi:hypothetical protein